MKNLLWVSGALVSVVFAACANNPQPQTVATTAPASASSSEPCKAPEPLVSKWKGEGGNGMTSTVEQTMSSETEGSFSESLALKDGTKVETFGYIHAEPNSQTNFYFYTKPKLAVVKVTTEEKDDGKITIDTVVESNSEYFSVGDKITYTKQ